MTSDRKMYSRSLQPIDPEVREQFVAYAGGYAAGLHKRVDANQELTAQEKDWLMLNTGRASLEIPYSGPDLPTDQWLAMCKELEDAYTLQQITQRLKS